MNPPNENIDPRSLPNLAHLLSNSPHKRNNNKFKPNKGSPAGSGLKDSFLHNLSAEHTAVLVDTQLPTPPNSQSMNPEHDKSTLEETRLPISPPPEEEIRIKELFAHGHTPRQPQSRLPVPSRAAPPATFKFQPQTFAHYQQRTRQFPAGGPAPTTLAADEVTNANANPRKRTRSTIPPPIPPTFSVPAAPTKSTGTGPSAASSTVAQSPNPKPRKQPKVHETGVYGGSGFKRRHRRGTSSESLDERDGEASASLNLTSPARKKRTHDPGVEDYTPQRERASTSTKEDSQTKSKPRARRSGTPDVRYEPPSEQFTPPRKVVLQAPSSTISARLRRAKPSSTQSVASSERKVVRVKPERLTSPFPLPSLDLTKPVPPPSPTEDPILLLGPPAVKRKNEKSRRVNKTSVDLEVGSNNAPQEPITPVRAPPSVDDHGMDESRWGMAPTEETALMDVAFDGPSHFDATFEPDSDSDGDDGGTFDNNAAGFDRPQSPLAVNTFDPNQSTGSQIFHSDDDKAEAETGEDEGEYTGRFKFYSVPVKEDPPSSATRARRDSWGRPISPFPFSRRLSGPHPQEVEEGEQGPEGLSDNESPPPSPAIRSGGDGDDELAVMNDYDDDSASSDGDTPALGIVEVSSDDPKAAARAAAILKLHHSYILDGVVAKRARRHFAHQSRRASFAFGDEGAQESQQNEDAIRCARRKSIANTGGVLQFRPRQTSHSPLARSVCVAPRSPAGSVISPEEALEEAETHIRATSTSPRGPRTPLRSKLFETETPQPVLDPPSPIAHHTPSLHEPQQQPVDKKEWTKADWKKLDTCFTDERIATARAMGLDEQLADVDDVEIETVVSRFLIDAQEAEQWDRAMLHRRATALSARQRAGQGAPPSPSRLTRTRPADPEITVPAFTPSAALRTFMPPPEVGVTKKLPPSLLAPRYAHLHEEAEQSSSPSNPRTQEEEASITLQTDVEPTQDFTQPSTPQPSRSTTHSRPENRTLPPAVPASTTKRVLGYLGSFLGRGGAATTTKPALKPIYGALPLPPPEMRQTARGPVTTPAKKLIPKSQAPRELVHLAETQIPSKTVAPKAKSAKEMVSLNHIDPPRSVQRPRTASGPIMIPGRTRKDSGGSVKDLVRSFEEVQKRTQEEMTRLKGKAAMRKVASVGDLKFRTPWRP